MGSNPQLTSKVLSIDLFSLYVYTYIYREPDPKKRITFDNVVGKLCSNSGMILKWENRNNTSSPSCSVLGAPLQHGQELYKDLQMKYHVDVQYI